MKRLILPYNEASELLQEADVLLFEHGAFPSVGWLIAKYSQSPYSHVGLASKEGKNWNCLEFREFIGSRKYPLEQYVKDQPGKIDVFRACHKLVFPSFEYGHVFDKELVFYPEIAHKITDSARELIGQSYSWYLIYSMTASFIPFLRLKQKIKFEDESDTISFVCSTLVNYTYRRHYTDLVKFLPDYYTKPGDIARSPVLNYLFTLGL